MQVAVHQHISQTHSKDSCSRAGIIKSQAVDKKDSIKKRWAREVYVSAGTVSLALIQLLQYLF